MIKTPNLNLPIYNTPSTDKFDLAEWNNANTKIDTTYGEILNFRELIPTVNANAEIIEARQGEATLGANVLKISSSLEQIINENVIINRLGINPGDDIYDIVTEQFARPNVGKVTVLAGKYTTKDRIVVPANKILELQGEENTRYIETLKEVDESVYTIIKPTFTDKSVIELKSRSTIIKGFIDCTNLQSGSAIFLNPSQTFTWSPTIKYTKGLGSGSLKTQFIGINCDRPTGTKAGFLVYSNFDFACFYFGTGLLFTRQDNYIEVTNGTGGGINDCCWSTSHKIKGSIGACNRAVFVNSTFRGWAFGSTHYNISVQGSTWFDNEKVPAFEIPSDDNKINIQWHDISPTQHQKIRMKLNTAVNNIIYNSARTDKDVVDNTQINTYLKDSVCETNFTNILEGATFNDEFTLVNGNTCLISFMATLPKTSTWTKLCNVPFYSSKKIRLNVKSVVNTNITLMISGNSNELSYIMPGNAVVGETITANFIYPLLNT